MHRAAVTLEAVEVLHLYLKIQSVRNETKKEEKNLAIKSYNS